MVHGVLPADSPHPHHTDGLDHVVVDGEAAEREE